MASSKKDMRRPDLVIPFIEPEKDKDADVSGTLSTTMPMMAMFTRNKMIGWVSMVFSVQTWLAETPESSKNNATPGYLAVIMGLIGLGTCYLPLFLPPPASTTGSAQPPAPAS